ncbi:MAG: hypothetical protein HUJ68_11045 [Clostridia bacterium]|nr:hypothetical protein [Clostridia bacterium]
MGGDETQKDVMSFDFKKEDDGDLFMKVSFTDQEQEVNLKQILIYKVLVKAYSETTPLNESVVGSKEIFVHVVPVDKNFIIYDNQQLELDDINPNKFC